MLGTIIAVAFIAFMFGFAVCALVAANKVKTDNNGRHTQYLDLYPDGRLDRIDELFALVRLENQRQLAKWGIQYHTIFEWLAYATEEHGELSDAISEHFYRGGSKRSIVMEAIHAVTLHLKIAEMFLPEKYTLEDYGRSVRLPLKPEGL